MPIQIIHECNDELFIIELQGVLRHRADETDPEMSEDVEGLSGMTLGKLELDGKVDSEFENAGDSTVLPVNSYE